MTREEWLQASVDALRPTFKAAGHDLPRKIHVGVGFTSWGLKTDVTAETWPREYSIDGSNQIFISPDLTTGWQVLAVLTHELVHAQLDCESGHMHPFQKIAKSVGLVAPWVNVNINEYLDQTIANILKEVGEYPGPRFKGRDILTKEAAKKPSMIRLICPGCGCLTRMTRYWIDKGLPTCQCGEKFEEK